MNKFSYPVKQQLLDKIDVLTSMFPQAKKDRWGTIWYDSDGFEYRTGGPLPTKLDTLIFLYILWRSKEEGYKKEVQLTFEEIVVACDLPKTKDSLKTIDEAISRWFYITLDFKGNFYDGQKYIAMGFHIINSFAITTDDIIEITLNSNWLTKIRAKGLFAQTNVVDTKKIKRCVAK